jgi:hypothetical protein
VQREGKGCEFDAVFQQLPVRKELRGGEDQMLFIVLLLAQRFGERESQRRFRRLEEGEIGFVDQLQVPVLGLTEIERLRLRAFRVERAAGGGVNQPGAQVLVVRQIFAGEDFLRVDRLA